jgi:hypothetical protein
MSTKVSGRSPGQDWIAIVRKSGSHEFAAAFAAQPVLYTSVMNAPCTGIQAIAAFFAATSGMYDTIAFTDETVDGRKTYLEWEGKFFGQEVGGATILTRNEAGLIESVRLYHRPLSTVVLFSAELARRLAGKVAPTLFGIPG